MTNEPLQLTSQPCRSCQAGVMHLKYMTYFTWLGEELVTVPNFPGWVCDMCGRREYDMHAVNQLTLLLIPNAGKRTARQPGKPRPTGTKPSSRAASE